MSTSDPQQFNARYCQPLQSRRRTRPVPVVHNRPMVLRDDIREALFAFECVVSLSVDARGSRIVVELCTPTGEPDVDQQVAIVRAVRGEVGDFRWNYTTSPRSSFVSQLE